MLHSLHFVLIYVFSNGYILWDESSCLTQTLINYEAWRGHGGGGSRKGKFRVEISYGLWGSCCHPVMDSFRSARQWVVRDCDGMPTFTRMLPDSVIFLEGPLFPFEDTSPFLCLQIALFRTIGLHPLSVQWGEPLDDWYYQPKRGRSLHFLRWFRKRWVPPLQVDLF